MDFVWSPMRMQDRYQEYEWQQVKRENPATLLANQDSSLTFHNIKVIRSPVTICLGFLSRTGSLQNSFIIGIRALFQTESLFDVNWFRGNGSRVLVDTASQSLRDNSCLKYDRIRTIRIYFCTCLCIVKTLFDRVSVVAKWFFHRANKELPDVPTVFTLRAQRLLIESKQLVSFKRIQAAQIGW